MPTKHRSRCVVLGLDGLPYSLARNLGASGHCPNLAHLLDLTSSKAIQSEIPDLSPVNWTSFFTASGPEEHGVFGFANLDQTSYALTCTDFTRVRAPTIFDQLGEQGRISKVVNLPNTYPARPIKGMLISGFVAHDLESAVYPKFLLPRLQAEGYKLEADTEAGREDFNILLGELSATLASRRKALDLFWPDLAWDLFVFVLTETDRLGHFLFPALVDDSHPWHSPCMDLMRTWDRVIGDVLERYQALPDPKRLICLADHGFTTLQTEVDLNAWLKGHDLLHLEARPGSEWDSQSMTSRTRAFALDPGRIFIHTTDRFSRGRVNPQEAASISDDLRQGLLGLNYGGNPVFEAILTGEELYPGSPFPDTPDLVCIPKPGFDLKAKFDRGDIFGFFGRTGTHTFEDVFFATDSPGEVSRVRDTGSLALEAFQESSLILATT